MPAGTWNLGRLRKRVDKVGLRDLGISRIDRSPFSDQIFNVVDFPDVLTGGKNLFKIKASANTLVKDSTIHVEVLDSNGNPIYYEPINYLEADGTRVVAIYIYPDTPYGTATVYLAGRLQRDLETGRPLRSSKDVNDPDYLNFPNVLWERRVTVAPERLNSTEIIFTKKPKLTIQEVVQPYLEPVNLTNVATASNGVGTYVIKPKPNSVSVSTGPAGALTNDQVLQGGFSDRSPASYFGQQISINPASLTRNTSLDNDGNVVSAATTEIITAINESRFETTEPFFTGDMSSGDVITVVNPLIEVPEFTVGNSEGQALPSSQAGFQSGISGDGSAVLGTANGGGGGTLNGVVPLSGSFRFVIDTVLTSKKADVVLIDGFLNEADNNTGGRFAVNVFKKTPEFFNEQGLDNEVVTIAETQPSSNYTCSFTLPFVYSTTEQSQSFAEIKLGNIEPATGDVYKVKTMYKAGGAFGDFVDAGDTVLEQLEVLEDTGSFEGLPDEGAIYNRIGFFTSEADFDQYFTTSPFSIAQGQIVIDRSFEPDELMSGIQLSPGGTIGTNQFSAVAIRDEYMPTLTPETNYILSFRAYGDATVSTTDPDVLAAGPTKPRMEIYISGSNGNIQADGLTRDSYLRSVFEVYENALDGKFADESEGGIFGTRIGSIQLDASGSLTPAFFRFRHNGLSDQPAKLIFVIRNGKFSIADVSLKTFNESKFTPNFTRINTRIPTQFLKTPLTFKIEFYDYLNNRADAVAKVFPITFTGENTVLGGTNNLFTGSVYIGNAVGSGIELAGVSSAFIRSIGYEGFTSASRTDQPGGFFMYTGSVLGLTPDNYDGVGLEIVEHSESFLRFATADNVSGKPAGLEVRTPRFFLGSSNQFISGADGNIEISSSNFHLDNAGDVVMQGTITAEAGGTIGGFTIGTNDLTATNFSLDTSDKRITLGSGNNVFIADADDGIQLGHATFASAPFSVTPAGVLKAESGTVGGFTLAATSLSATNFSLDTSAKRLTLGASSNIFIADADEGIFLGSDAFATAPFSVDLQGNMSASAGNIASWGIEADKLSNVGVHLSASYGLKVFSNEGTDFAELRYKATDDWGIRGVEAGSTLFELGSSNQIAGWKFDSSKIISNNGVNSQANPGIVINSNGTIETDPFISGLTANATGWQIRSDGRAEFENAVIRGTLSTAVFEKDTVSVVGGQVMVANAAKLDKPEERFKDYPMVKSPTGEDLNLSGETLPSTGSSTNGYGNAFNGAINATFVTDDDETVTANNILDGDLWYKVSRNGSLDFLSIQMASSSIVDRQVRVTMYTSGSGILATFVTGSTISNGFKASSYTGTGNGGPQGQYTKLSSGDEGTLFHSMIFDVPESIEPVCQLGLLNTDSDEDPFYIRDIHIMAVSQSLTVDNAGGFVNGEILVAKSTDQGPDGREGFVREYMRVLDTDLGSSETPASGTFDFGPVTITTGTDVFVTASKFYTFSGTTTNEVDSIANNQYYFEVNAASKAETLGNLKSKINAEVPDVFVNTTGSNAGTIDQLYMQAVDQGLDGNSYGIQVGATQVQLQGAQARTKPTLTVERNLDARVEGNERGFFIAKMKDGQSMASQGSDGTGYILLNAQPTDTNTPYIDIVERQGSGLGSQQHTGDDADSVFGTVNTLVRIGDLSGITDNNFSDGVSGYGIYTANGFFKGKIEVASQPSVPDNEHLMAHYPLDSVQVNDLGEYYLPDNSGNNVHASASADDVTYIVSGSGMGPSGFAVDFNQVAAEQVKLDSFTSSLASGQDLSFTFWASGSNSNGVIFEMSDTQQHSPLGFGPFTYRKSLVQLYYGIADTAIVLRYPTNDNADYTTQYYSEATYTPNITTGSWNHYAVVLPHGGTPCLYIDGIKRSPSSAYSTVNLTSITASTDVFIGTGERAGDIATAPALPAYDDRYTGCIAEFRIYNTELTSQNVEALYLGPNAAIGRTTIEGDRLTTGKIRSNNWGPSLGSRFDLDAGTFQLGGSDNPPFEWDGSNLKVTGSNVSLEAPTFFLGSANQFVSGADGNIEISSSNFHLDNDGSVVMQGSITAEAGGTIGGFSIGDDKLSSTNLILSSSTTGTDFIISASNFNVKGNGEITASGVLIDGNARITSDVTIEGELTIGDIQSTVSASTHVDNFHQAIDTNKYYNVDVFQSQSAITVDGAPLSGSRFYPSAAASFNAHTIIPKQSFSRASAPELVVDVVCNNGDADTVIGFFGYNAGGTDDPTSLVDGTTYNHLSDAFYFRDNDFAVYSEGTFDSVNRKENVFTGGTDRRFRLVIQIKPAGGARYTVYADTNFTVPFFEYENSDDTTETIWPIIFPRMNNTGGSGGDGIIIHNFQVSSNGISPPSNATLITGDGIKTGKIQSNNWGSSAGSELDLNAGTFKLGGSSSPKLEWDGSTLSIDGTVTANDGEIGGFNINANNIKSDTNITGTSIPALQLDANGTLSGSNLYVRNKFEGTLYTMLDTYNGIVDGRNVARHIYSHNQGSYYRSATSTETYATMDELMFVPLPYETHLTMGFVHMIDYGSADYSQMVHKVKFTLQSSSFGDSSSEFLNHTNVNQWGGDFNLYSFSRISNAAAPDRSYLHAPNARQYIHDFPERFQGKLCRLHVEGSVYPNGTGTTTLGAYMRVYHFTLGATRTFAAENSLSDVQLSR